MKIFRNVNTIFDKIKRGDIERSETRMFNRIDYYKKPELIKPHLHYLDSNRLQNNVDKHIDNIFQRKDLINNINYGRGINKEKLYQDAHDFYRNSFPEEVTADIFNMYHKEASKLDYEEKTSKNQFRYKILDQLVDPVAKVVTKDSNLKSMIMTKNMVEYFSIMMAYQKQVDEEQYEKLKNKMNSQSPNGDGDETEGDGEEDGDSNENKDQSQSNNKAGKNSSDSKSPLTADQILEKLMNNKPMQELHDQLIEDAKKQISDVSDIASEEEMEVAWEKGSTGFTKKDIDRVKREFEKLSINMDSITAAIKKLLDKTTNYFTGKEIIEYNPIFDSDTLDGLQDYELLHPKLRKLMVDDIMIKNVYKEGKIDLYIDTSGSMDESFQYGDRWITKLDFTKVFALQMIKMNILNNIYAFDSKIRKINNTHYSILLMDDGGGTDINNVINQVNKEQNNAIIITDAEDHCGIYSDKAYFIGVKGCRFNYFNDEVIKKYSENNQAIQFDGSGIRKIKPNGHVE